MKTLAWLRLVPAGGNAAVAAPFEPTVAVAPPAFRALTIMLTELCNLDCWMCDFARSKGLQTRLPWGASELADMLSHPVFAQLRRIVFTGGEPFAYAGIHDLYGELQHRFPKLTIAFSSNATLHARMAQTFRLCRDWRRIKLLTSIDGIEMHDVQRGVPGAFRKSFGNLQELRAEFPRLAIELKFTITPRNVHELLAAWEHCTAHGFAFTAKMVENNANYTNRLSHESHRDDFTLSDAARADLHRQLDAILARDPRHRPMRELRDSLAPGWRRGGRCMTPSEGAFLDSRLNLFTCKEYPPVVNLARGRLDDIAASAAYRHVAAQQACNGEHCTHCTSPQKLESVRLPWVS